MIFDLFLSCCTVLILMCTLWGISLIKKNASLVDIFWGLGFVLLNLIYHFRSGNPDLVFTALVNLWGIRLSAHIAARSRGRGEDRRYQAMRVKHQNFAFWSLFGVFIFQGLLIWLLSLPFFMTHNSQDQWGVLRWIGILTWGIGFFFEAVGDWQLAKFKALPENRGRVLREGLWRYTRHPNYFGDSMVWWGFALIAIASTGAWWLVYSPVIMTVFLLRISGVSLLEKDISDRRPEYSEYIRTTPAFLPGRPKQRTKTKLKN